MLDGVVTTVGDHYPTLPSVTKCDATAGKHLSHLHL